MIDYFLSGFDGCCLNCPEEERGTICGSGIWCDRCLCLKGCEYYRLNLGDKRGYCGISKQLLHELQIDYSENPEAVRSYIDSLKAQGIKVPKVVRDMAGTGQQEKLF